MGESVDIEDARRAAAAMSRMLTQLEGRRRKPTTNIIVLALDQKLSAPKPTTTPAETLRAAE